MATMTKDNADRLQSMLDKYEAGEMHLHPKAAETYRQQLAAADIKRGPGRPKKEDPEPAPEAAPHDDYVPEGDAA